MLTTMKNWKLVSYTNATWTDVVNEVATVATLIISNTSASVAITSSIRLSGGAVIVPPTSIASNSSVILDIKSLNIVTGESLQAHASAAGIHIVASGAA